MKLIDWIKFIDPIVDVIIFVDSEQEIRYEGSLLNMPWYLINHEIGRINKDEDKDEPIFISCRQNEYGAILPTITINLISTEFI